MPKNTPIVLLVVMVAVAVLCAQEGSLQTRYKVKYVSADAVYLEAGKNAGLSPGLTLVIRPSEQDLAEVPANGKDESATPIIAELKVVSVASVSAVCELVSAKRRIVAGEYAYMPQEEAEALIQKNALSGNRSYPVLISFTEGDPLDEEVREYVPKPPLPEINRARGRIGMDYSALRAGGINSSQVGFVFRTDISRIGGTYWNLSGYWRGRLDQRSGTGQLQTMQDVINRTYHLELSYNNPNARWVAGFGRLYLPWATSLDTIDGGYYGRKLGHNATAGVFAGTTPDPTSWSYNPNREIAGSFINFEGGSFDDFRYTTTFGFGVSALSYRIDRPFAFDEVGLFFKRYFSLYSSQQIDSPRSPIPGTKIGAGLGRSYITLRIQPNSRIAFDLNHNYFRDIPTYDPTLIATGLVDKLLFQGVSGGVRVDLPRHFEIYTNIGSSNKTGDTRNSLNQLYGVRLGRIPWTGGFQIDARYSKFASAFGSGSYRAVSVSRNFGDAIRWQTEIGSQTFLSTLTKDTGSKFLNTTADINLGRSYFMEAGFMAQRGATMSYNQFMFTFGYRFDSREKHR
jgi:hypothetical protein